MQTVEAIEAEFRPIVKRIARRLSRRVPGHMLEREDLEAIGMVGLLEAIKTYDESFGVPFRPYAIRRVMGQMIDDVRKLDPVPHPTRAILRRSDRASEDLAQRVGETAEEGSAAAEAGMRVGQLRSLRDRSAALAQPRHIDERVAGDEHDPLTLGDTVAGGCDPFSELEERGRDDELRKRLLLQLTPLELEAAMLINVDGFTYSETAALLKLPLMEAMAIVGRVEFKLGARNEKGELLAITPKRKAT